MRKVISMHRGRTPECGKERLWETKGPVLARPDGPSDTWARDSRVCNNTAEKRQQYLTCPPGQPMHRRCTAHAPPPTVEAGTDFTLRNGLDNPCTADAQPMHHHKRPSMDRFYLTCPPG